MIRGESNFDDKYVEKSVQLVRGSSFPNDLLQNPYFKDKEDVPKRVALPDETKLEKGNFFSLWEDQERYINHLETKLNGGGGEFDPSDEKIKNDEDVSKREHLLVCRLAIKEQELQELSNQVAELKAAQAPSMSALRNALLGQYILSYPPY